MVITVTSSRTIQEFANNITGSAVNAIKLMEINKLKSQNLTSGQKINVPDSMISASAKQRMAAMKSSNMKKMLPLLGVAAIGLYMVKDKLKIGTATNPRRRRKVSRKRKGSRRRK